MIPRLRDTVRMLKRQVVAAIAMLKVSPRYEESVFKSSIVAGTMFRDEKEPETEVVLPLVVPWLSVVLSVVFDIILKRIPEII